MAGPERPLWVNKAASSNSAFALPVPARASTGDDTPEKLAKQDVIAA